MKRLAQIFCFLIFFLPLQISAFAAVYYVSKGGGAHPAGSDTAPYDTWEKASTSPRTILNYISSSNILGPHTIYLDSDVFEGADYCYFDDPAHHSDTTMIGAGRDDTILKPSSGHSISGDGADNITIQDMTVYASGGSKALFKSDGSDNWLLENVNFISNSDSTTSLVWITGGSTNFAACNFEHKYTSGTYAVYCEGDTSGIIKFCTFQPTRSFDYTGAIILYGSGTFHFLNSVIVGAQGQALVANSGTVNVKNSIFQGGLINSGASTIQKIGGTLNLEHNMIIGNLWAGDAFIEGIPDTDSNNIKTNLSPRFKTVRRGFILPCVDDAGNFSYAQHLASALESYNMKGTFFLEQTGWSNANNADLRTMVENGVLEVACHSYSHSDVDVTGKIWNVTKGAETFSINRSEGTITLSGGGSVSGFRSKSLSVIKGELEALGATVAPSAIYEEDATTPGHVKGNALGEVIADGTATNQVSLLIDTSANSGYFKAEIADPKSWLADTIINGGGTTTDGQTGLVYVCNSFGAPYNSLDADSRASIMNSGFTSGRGSLDSTSFPTNVVYGTDINMFALTCVSAGWLDGPTEEIVRLNARAFGLAVVYSGMILPVLAHYGQELSIAKWGYCFDEWSKIDGLTVTSHQLMASTISTGGNWSDDGDGTYSRTYEPLNFSLDQGSPCINAGINPFGDGDGDQYDMGGLLVWSDDAQAPVGPWGDGVEIGAYGYVVTPRPDIKANGQDGPLVVSSNDAVSITVTLDADDKAGVNADWWIAASTPFGWFSYVYPSSWEAGINLCIQTPIFNLLQPVEVLNIPLPYPGVYNFYFAIDSNANGVPDPSWFDIVTVTVK